jgi:hypothetical protein
MPPLVRVFAGMIVCVLGAGCSAAQGCPPFAHIVAVDFGRTTDAVWWTLEVQQLPDTLTFNQGDVPANFLEYRWAVDIDSDRNGTVDLRAAIEHFVAINADPIVVAGAQLLSQTTEDLLEVMGGASSTIGGITASVTGNTFRLEAAATEAPGLATVIDRAQSTWTTSYRFGAEIDDQCDEQYP